MNRANKLNVNVKILLHAAVLSFRRLLHCLKSVQIRSFFWSVFSGIRTEYGEIRSISPYSVQMRENADMNNSDFRYLLHSENYALRFLKITVTQTCNILLIFHLEFLVYQCKDLLGVPAVFKYLR